MKGEYMNLEEMQKEYWHRGFSGNMKIVLKWKPYEGLYADPNQKKPEAKRIETDYGIIEEIIE